MTTAKKPTVRRTTARKAAARRTTTRSSTASTTAGRRTSSRRTTTTRRRRPAVATTVGTAVGTLVVTSLLSLSWPARIGLVVLVLLLGLGYLLWHNRAEIRAGAEPAATSTEAAGGVAPTADPGGPA